MTERPGRTGPDRNLLRALYLAGCLAPVVFLLSVVLGGLGRPDYSHLADPVSALGMSGAADAGTVNAAWTVTGLLVMALGLALWRDRRGPGRLAGGAVLAAGAASAAIALWFPMDPPGAPMSIAQGGHNGLVVLAALAFAMALLASGRSPAAPAVYRQLSWAALAAMGLGGAGAALSHSLGWDWIGGFERITQAGYHGWLLATGAVGMAGRWRSSDRPLFMPDARGA